jgi:hypothetical protein
LPDFEISWALGRVQWHVLNRLALLNPPGSEFDQTHGMLSSHRSVAQEREVNFLVDSVPLFGPDAYPFHISILELALLLAKRRETVLAGDGEVLLGFHPMETNWMLEIRRDGDALAISSNYQTNQTLRCSTRDFVAGVERFLDVVTARLFVHAPQTLAWQALAPLKRYLDFLFAARTELPSPRNGFLWDPDDVDWERARRRRALNPPGSEYDNDDGEAATELFGAPLKITAKGIVIQPTIGLRSPGSWRVAWDLRRSRGREIAMLAELLPGEPWPLLDFALQLATYVRPSRGRNLVGLEADDDDETTRSARSQPVRRSPVLDRSLILSLEQEMGAAGLKVAARDFIRDFVRVVYARGDDATAWHMFRPLRELAF